jgi:hypothetical protein
LSPPPAESGFHFRRCLSPCAVARPAAPVTPLNEVAVKSDLPVHGPVTAVLVEAPRSHTLVFSGMM